jgi:hypothetical protein
VNDPANANEWLAISGQFDDAEKILNPSREDVKKDNHRG